MLDRLLWCARGGVEEGGCLGVLWEERDLSKLHGAGTYSPFSFSSVGRELFSQQCFVEHLLSLVLLTRKDLEDCCISVMYVVEVEKKDNQSAFFPFGKLASISAVIF